MDEKIGAGNFGEVYKGNSQVDCIRQAYARPDNLTIQEEQCH